MNIFKKNRETMFKGHLENASGETAILNQSNGDPLRNYKIYGNTKSELVATATSNLLDLSNREHFEAAEDYSRDFSFDKKYVYCKYAASSYSRPNLGYTINGNSIKWKSDEHAYGIGFNIRVIAGKTYTTSFTPITTHGLTVLALYTFYSGTQKISHGSDTTFTVPDGVDNCIISFAAQHPSDNTMLEFEITDIQVEQGSEATDYQPYQPTDLYDIKGLGETSKNLFDIENPLNCGRSRNDLSYFSIKVENGIIYSGGKYAYSAGTYLLVENKNGEEIYTISGKYSTKSFLCYSIVQCDAIENNIMQNFEQIYSNENVTMFNWTGTVTKRYFGFAFWGKERYDVELTNVMIEQGSTATEYEPYYPHITIKSENENENIKTFINMTGHEPLRKIGDVADYIDYKQGCIIRNINKRILGGTENWIKGGSGGSNVCCYFATLNNKKLGYQTSICTHFNNINKAWSINTPNIYSDHTSYGRIYVSTLKIIRTAEEWKQWLAEQKEVGTPVVLYYQFETPVVEPITLPQVKTAEYTNEISAYDENISASNIELQYYQK